MVDPTSDLGEDVSEAEAPRCAVCEAAIVQSPTHRVVTHVEGDSVVTTHFCGDDCRSEWRG